MDAINPAHGSLLRVNSPSHGIFSNIIHERREGQEKMEMGKEECEEARNRR